MTWSAGYLVSHGGLLARVTRNELIARYAGSILGFGWVVLAPLLILSVYALVYLAIFRVQAPGLTSQRYVLYIFAGLVPFLMTSEALSVGVSSIVGARSVLNNTAFPIELVPVKTVLASQPTMVVGLVAILLGLALTQIPLTVLAVPVIWALHLLFLVGINWILSLLTLVFRDLQNLVGVILTLMLVASPIAYTPEMIPAQLVPLFALNPMAYFVTAYQDVLVRGVLPGLGTMVLLFVMSIGLFFLGGRFFAAAKHALLEFA